MLDEQNDRQYSTVGCLTPSKIELVDLDEPRRRAQDIDGQIRTIHEGLELKRGKSFNKPSKSGVSGPVKFEAPYQKWANLITSPMRKFNAMLGPDGKNSNLCCNSLSNRISQSSNFYLMNAIVPSILGR